MNGLFIIKDWAHKYNFNKYNFIENTKFLPLCFNLDYQIKFNSIRRIGSNVQTEIILTEYSVLSACNGLTASLCQWFSITSMFIHLKSSAGSRDPYTENLSQLTIGLLSFVIFYSALIHSFWATGKKTLTEVIAQPSFPWYLHCAFIFIATMWMSFSSYLPKEQRHRG